MKRGGASLPQSRSPESEGSTGLPPDALATKLKLAISLHQQGKLDQAEAFYQEILQSQPEHFDALRLLATIAAQRGNSAVAVELFDRALKLNPEDAEALNNRGNALQDEGHLEAAVESYDRALGINPRYAEALFNRGNALLALKCLEEALKSHMRALEIKPGYAEASFNLGNVLLALGRPGEALKRYDRALEIRPGHVEALYNRGIALIDLRRGTEALESYDRALKIKPDYAEALHNRSTCMLLEGDFANGFREYESRWQLHHLRASRREFGSPLWLGAEVLAGRTILLHAEQGFGDMIQFCRYAPLAAAQGARVVLEVPAALKSLCRSLPGVDMLLAAGQALPPFDFHAPLLSLPLAFGTRLDTIPADIPYLRADPAIVAAWQTTLGSHSKPRIGLAWSGRSTHTNDRNRTISFSQLAGLIDDSVEFICLQKEFRAGEEAAARECGVRIVKDELKDFADTAALIETLDLVITVDTSVAHLAGALGKPVWILLPFVPDWRWLLDREDSPWYPSAILLRQQQLGQWLPVVAEVRKALVKFSAGLAARLPSTLPAATPAAEAESQPGELAATDPIKLITAVALHRQGKLDQAEALYLEILRSQPEHFNALQLLATVCSQRKDSARAVDLFDRALRINPNHAVSHNNRGNALRDLKRPEEALESYERALRIKPGDAGAHNNRGNILLDLKRPEDALEDYERALGIKPDYAEAYFNRGSALLDLNRPEEALESYERALEIKPDYAEALSNRGVALRDLTRLEDALASYERALKIKPDYAEAHYNCGSILRDLKRPKEALESYQRALEIKPDQEYLYGSRLLAKMQICDWSDLQSEIAQLVEKIERDEKASTPFTVLAISGSAELLRRVAEIWVRAKYPMINTLPAIAKRPRKGRIRIGYFSADFHNHATAHLMAELFERHDKSKFELIGFSFGPDKTDEMRRRVASAFDKFIDVRSQSDKDVAILARSMEIDIAVDLKGFTQGSRPGIFSMRAAPIQINYLGYPGTMGSEFIDYLIADPTLIPESHQKDYAEKIAYLPNSYQVNDTQRRIADKTFSRAELGLPQAGFVFCCFNNNYKITPSTFDSWMRILKQVEGGVLWLLADNAEAASNLRKEAADRGIEADRLLFATRLPLPEHLARHHVADLFLDTLPCNAHTTASDALWAGLPVLTCIGETFAGRVAASLLKAIDLPELVTTTSEAYEALAIELALTPCKLRDIRQKLAVNRLTTPLFDAERFTRHLEAAYTTMYERYQADLAPEHFNISEAFLQSSDDPAARRTSILPTATPAAKTVLQPRETSATEAAKLTTAVALHRQGKLDQAEAIYKEILQSQPEHFNALQLLAAIAGQRKDSKVALDLLDKVLHMNPRHASSLNNRGSVLMQLGRHREAVEDFDRAIEIRPDYAEAQFNRGGALSELGCVEEALASYDCALRIKPGNAEALNNRGIVLRSLTRLGDAVESYDLALKAKPDYAEALNNRGNAYGELGLSEQALKSYDLALKIKPEYAEALNNRGGALLDLSRYEDALASYERAVKMEPGRKFDFLAGNRLDTKLQMCDWRDLGSQLDEIAVGIERGEKVSTPFLTHSISNSPALQRKAADIWVRAKRPAGSPLPKLVGCPSREKIRIGYFSSDFRDHPVSYLTAELFELHDRSRFELTAFSFGPRARDGMRQRIEAAFESYIDIRDKSDKDVAILARDIGIDIAVDLGGFTRHARSGIFALRPAPVQASYLGFLGTMGARYIDYLIADSTIIPETSQRHYSEKIAYLPSYQINDRKRRIADKCFTRDELGLPPAGFVYCCFNNCYKILPEVFDRWMRILDSVPGSVLWLFEGNPAAKRNLQREATHRGIDPQRLVFGARMGYALHLARYRAADLFLDTLPYNAGTTASDALWAGLPVLTCSGETFAGRVGASLLNAIDLPELVVTTPEQYEALAIDLALNPGKLRRIRERLVLNRSTKLLFNAEISTRHLEAAYTAMHERYQVGLAPEHIHVPLDPGAGGPSMTSGNPGVTVTVT